MAEHRSIAIQLRTVRFQSQDLATTRVIQITATILLTFCICSVLFAQGALSGSHTTADCIADVDCTKTVLSRIETRMGGLEYMAGFPTAATVARIYDEMDDQRAVLAHQISDNLVSFYSMHVGPQEAIEGAQMGDLVVWENFLDPKGQSGQNRRLATKLKVTTLSRQCRVFPAGSLPS